MTIGFIIVQKSVLLLCETPCVAARLILQVAFAEIYLFFSGNGENTRDAIIWNFLCRGSFDTQEEHQGKKD
ncbi:MAG: hypothetical protein J5595_08320 [Bacteroidales bacterium]|nr:hypothetical protein [Bacteroidales bacterium]